MKTRVPHWLLLGTGVFLFLTAPVWAAAAPVKPLLDVTNPAAAQLLTPSNGSADQVTVAPSPDPKTPGLVVTIKPGPAGYPGVQLKPPAGASTLDLSTFGHIEAKVTNTGAHPMLVALRIDSAGDWHDSPWNTEQVYLKPGQTGAIKVIFGYAYGHKPAYPLKASAITGILFFTDKTKAERSFRIDSLVAAGPAGEKPPVNPESIRIQPAAGYLIGGQAKFDPAQQVTTFNDAHTGPVPQGSPGALELSFPPSQKPATIKLKPPVGRWDLRNSLEIQVQLRNTGQAPVTLRCRADSNGGPSDWVALTTPLLPGAQARITIPFITKVPWNGTRDSGNRITNAAISANSGNNSNSN